MCGMIDYLYVIAYQNDCKDKVDTYLMMVF